MDSNDKFTIPKKGELQIFALNISSDQSREAFLNCEGDGSFVSPIYFNDQFYLREEGGQSTISGALSQVELYAKLFETCVFWKRQPGFGPVSVTIPIENMNPVTVTLTSFDILSGHIQANANGVFVPQAFENTFIKALYTVLVALNEQSLPVQTIECATDERSGDRTYNAWYLPA